MNATSKSDEDIWYGLRLPTRRCTPSFSAFTGNDRAGSTGRRAPSGGVASFIFVSAAATRWHTFSIGTTRDALRLLSLFSSTSVVRPTTPPPTVKTGPPAVPDGRLKSDEIACGSTRPTAPDVIS